MDDYESINNFTLNSTPENSILTLGGTGANCSIQVPALHTIGANYIDSLHQVNVISGSAFSYFIFLAMQENMLKIENLESFDRDNRRLHKASILKALLHIVTNKPHKNPLYSNQLICKTVNHLFKPQYANRALDELPQNLQCWSYCLERDELVLLSAKSPVFKQMNVIDIIRASVSIKQLHGFFDYNGYKLVDPNYSPRVRELRKKILQQKYQHLLLNHEKDQQRGSVTYVKHRNYRYPNIRLIMGMLAFFFNFHNRDLTSSNKEILHLLEVRK